MKVKTKHSSGSRQSVAGSRTESRSTSGAKTFPIVGIGASAGGLEAFTQLLKQLPLNTGFGFVLVQHLDPQHKSALTQLLARATAMPVTEVIQNLRVAPNRVYVIPPNASLSIVNGVLKLRARVRDALAHRTIDAFFEALATDQGERAIGVILSGTATDGTLGLEAIKAAGGLTFAQDDSARYDSMPRSAIAAGCVDQVLSPAAIARELARIAKHPFVAGSVPDLKEPPRGDELLDTLGDEIPLPAQGLALVKKYRRGERVTSATESLISDGPRGFQDILGLLRNHSGVDFSLYKPNTIHRRITRRTVLNRQNSLEKYAGFLRGNVKELDALYSDTLINVTSFFRNAEAFSVLQHKIFPRLLAQKSEEPLRVWVLGCSTGQEAYSIAMAFNECAEKLSSPRKLQIFATDLNDANLDKARHGLYARTLAQDVSPARLRRFFVEEDGGYRVIKPVRELVVFARQNVINDPPFSRMDLISCRNLMIYLEPVLQKKVIPTFHYALKPEGYLFLGASESIGGFTDLFASVDKKQKIFSRKTAPTVAFQLPVKNGHGPRPAPSKNVSTLLATAKKSGSVTEAFRGELNAEREADRVTVNQFAPPAVLINSNLQILQFRGPTGAFLEPPTGKASFDLLKMAREGLMLPLRSAINQAKKDNTTVRKENIPVIQNGVTREVHVEVVPLKNLKECCFLVLFEDASKRGRGTAESPIPEPSRGKKHESNRVTALEQDLAETRDYLQSIQEYQESSNEELQASNEEGQSANEELQSLNEELETSKEELESTNEELTTVNEEMSNRNTELNRLNSDLTNMETTTKVVVVLLGCDLTIRRFSVQAEKIFHLSASDIGRSVSGVRHNLRVPGLDAIIAGVIAHSRECEREVQDKHDRWYSLRVRPYLNSEGKVDGAVLVLIDIDALKNTERLITIEREHAEAVIRTVPNPLVVLNADLQIQTVNEAFTRIFQLKPKQVVGRSIFEVDRGSLNFSGLRYLLENIIPKKRFFNDFEVTQKSQKTGERVFLLNARVLLENAGKPKQILLGIRDITDRKQIEIALRASEERFRVLFDLGPVGVYSCGRDGIIQNFNQAAVKLWGRKPKLGGPGERYCGSFKLYRPDGTHLPHAACPMVAVLAGTTAEARDMEVMVQRRNGSRITVIANIVPLKNAQGEITGAINCFYDITDRKRMDEALRESRIELADHADHLESVVAKRTSELTASNRKLKASIAVVSNAKEQYHQLFLESQVMQKKLRQLTHQIIEVQEEERKEISRELHDSVVQTLVGINVELSALGLGTTAGGDVLKAKIAHTQQLVETSVDAVHRFARELRPAVLDDLGLIPALHAFSKNLAESKKIKIELTAFHGVESLESSNRTVLFRVAQEALHNVVRHAHATLVKINLTAVTGLIRMEVSDNGKSFQVKKTLLAKSNKRLGLVGMRERIEMVGGSLTIESAPGKGTTVRAEIPFTTRKTL